MSAAIVVDRLTPNGHGVRDLSFEVRAGTVFGFLGPNGAGKTTTIRLLLGLVEADAGQAYLLGRPIHGAARASDHDDVRALCGALVEDAGVYERLTAEENLRFFGGMFRLPAREIEARSKHLLEALDLWPRRKELVRTWSRGMRQKLAIARVLLHRPASSSSTSR